MCYIPKNCKKTVYVLFFFKVEIFFTCLFFICCKADVYIEEIEKNFIATIRSYSNDQGLQVPQFYLDHIDEF